MERERGGGGPSFRKISATLRIGNTSSRDTKNKHELTLHQEAPKSQEAVVF